MGNVSTATLSDASRLQLLTFINPSLDPLEVGLTRCFGTYTSPLLASSLDSCTSCCADMPLLQSFEDLLSPYQVGLPCVEYFKRRIYTGRVQTVPTVPQQIIQQQQLVLVSLNVASVNIDTTYITTVPHVQPQKHSVLPPLTLKQPQQSNTNQIVDITDKATTPQIKQQQLSVLPPLALIQPQESPQPSFTSQSVKNIAKERGGPLLQPQPSFTSQSSNRAISQHGGKAHRSNDRIAEGRGGPLLQPQTSYQPHSVANIDKERGGPLLQPQPSYQQHSVANIDKERGGPLLQPQPSFQPKGAANFAGIFTHRPFMHAHQSLDTLTHTKLCFADFAFNFAIEMPRTNGFESLVVL